MHTKRIALLAAVVLFVSVAPAAMAEHCFRCRYYPPTQEVVCAPALNIIGGWSECDEQPCTLAGVQCEPHGSLAPLASEFVVASVERLEDAPAKTNEVLFATADLPRPPTR